MSVAFRRDGDEEHLEPKFEIPIPPGPNRVTARGLAQIAERIAGLETQLAGTSDDTAATALKRDLRYWQTRQITAELVPPASGETAEFGTTVTFRLNGKQRVLAIVGDDEVAVDDRCVGIGEDIVVAFHCDRVCVALLDDHEAGHGEGDTGEGGDGARLADDRAGAA